MARFLLLLFAISAYAEETPISVAIILRHGARTMYYTEFSNITDNLDLLENKGSLTDVGKRTHYLAGRELSKRYPALISDRYFARASGLNRTIESAQAMLMGLLHDREGPRLSEAQRKSVAPPVRVERAEEIRKELQDAALPNHGRTAAIHTMMETNDYLYEASSACPAYAKSVREFQGDINSLEARYKPFIATLRSELKGKFHHNTWNTEVCLMLYDNMRVVLGNGHRLNINLTAHTVDMLQQCYFDNFMLHYLGGSLRPKLMAHKMLHEIGWQLSSSMKDAKTGKKMGIYLISDSHIMSVYKLFGWELKTVVPFASALIFELHKDEKSRSGYRLKVIYNDNEVKLNNSDAADFLKAINEKTFKDDEEFMRACMRVPPEEKKPDMGFYTMVSIGIFLLLALVWGISWYMVLSKKKPNSDESVSFTEDSAYNP